jgi:hypothetical protein
MTMQRLIQRFFGPGVHPYTSIAVCAGLGSWGWLTKHSIRETRLIVRDTLHTRWENSVDQAWDPQCWDCQPPRYDRRSCDLSPITQTAVILVGDQLLIVPGSLLVAASWPLVFLIWLRVYPHL